MKSHPSFLRLSCLRCNTDSTVPWEELLRQFRLQGKFRRESHPQWEEVLAIFELDHGLAGLCPSCEQAWSQLAPWTPLDDFTVTRRCFRCESLIDQERLEALPDTDICRDCASGQKKQAGDFCPRCGSHVRWSTRSTGNQYRQLCDSCGWSSSG